MVRFFLLEKQEMFDAHDEDHSGRLSFDEIVQVIETLMDSRTGFVKMLLIDMEIHNSSQLLFFKEMGDLIFVKDGWIFSRLLIINLLRIPFGRILRMGRMGGPSGVMN